MESTQTGRGGSSGGLRGRVAAQETAAQELKRQVKSTAKLRGKSVVEAEATRAEAQVGRGKIVQEATADLVRIQAGCRLHTEGPHTGDI